MVPMRLAQAWRRRGLGAAAVTLVVPGALAAAVAVVLLSGGLRGLGAFGQVVTGPQVPEASVSAAKVSASHTPARLPTVPPAPCFREAHGEDSTGTPRTRRRIAATIGEHCDASASPGPSASRSWG